MAMVYRLRRIVTVAMVTLCLSFVWYFVNYIGEERKEYEKISNRIQNSEIFSKCLTASTETSYECNDGFIQQGDLCAQCTKGTFSLQGWTVCKELLMCDDIHHDVRVSRLLYTLGNWKYYLAEWKSYEVLYAKTSAGIVSDIHSFPPRSSMLYSIGHCGDGNTVVYSYSRSYLGPASDLDSVLKQVGCDNLFARFILCLNYIHILDHLHSTPGGPHVLCNSHSVNHVLAQFLISEDLRLILANSDNLPKVYKDGGGVICSKSELEGGFVAPEQKWPYSQLKVFNFNEQPSYDEKTDVWKIPDVTRALLGHSEDAMWVLDYLLSVHHRCKRRDPDGRPSVAEVLEEYELVWRLISVGDRL